MKKRMPSREELERRIAQLEQKLEACNEIAAEKDFRYFYRHTPAILHTLDKEGRIVAVSDRWLKELGYTREEVIGKKSIIFLTEKSKKDAIEKYFPIYLRDGVINDVEYQFIKKDGEIATMLLSGIGDKDKDGNIVSSLAIMENITLQVEAQKTIKEKQLRYENLFKHSPVALWEEDFTEMYNYLNGIKEKGITDFEEYFNNHPEEILKCSRMVVITDVNDATLKLHQAKNKNELLGNLEKIFTPKSLDVFKDEVIAITKGETEFETEGEVKTLKGETRNVLLKLNVNQANDGTYLAIIATTDITDRKNAEDILNKTREQYKKLFDNSQVGMFRTNLEDGSFIDANKRAAAIAGYDDLEKFKREYKTSENYVVPQERDVVMKILKETGKIINHPVEMYNKDGNKYWVSLSGHINFENMVLEGAVSDLTDRKLAEEALKESEERFELAMQATNDGLYDWNLITNEIYYSPGWKSILGYKDDELENKFEVWEELTDPEDIKKSWTMLNDVLKGKLDRFELDFKMKHKKGHWVDIRSRANAFLNKDGKPVRVIGTHMDVTEQKKTLKSLEQEKKLTQQYLNVAAVMLIALDKNQRVTLINPKGCEILGYTYEEIIGQNWFDKFLTKENIKEVKLVFDQIISGKIEAVRYYENPIIRKDGTKRIIAWHNSLIEDETGIIGLFSSGTDITERIINEEIILKERLKANNILQGTNAGTWDWNIESGDISINDQWASMLGFKLEELQPITFNKWREMVHPDDLLIINQITKNHFNKEIDYYDAEFRMLQKNGNWIWINARGKVVEWKDDKTPVRMSGVHIAINKRKTIENELIKAKEKAEESDRLKSAFMANMSHEIRTPMNGIIGFTDLLKEPNLSFDQHERYVDVIQKSGQRMLSIINDIIDISKIEANQIEINISETNINEAIEYLYSFFNPEAKQKNLKLSYKTKLPNQLSLIKTDSEKLYAIFTNLLKNAIKYTDKGTIEFGYNIKGYEIEFYVKDTGIGVAKDHHNIIFDRFTQADMSITKPYEGAGLGLSITKAYVELLGGKIWIESDLGIGSSFYFSLPLNEQILPPLMPKVNEEATKQLNSLNKLTILTAEDDEIANMYLEEVIKGRCKELIQVTTGKEAVQICKDNKDIDLILMDLKMPEMDGYSATKEIRKFNDDIIIIAQTAYALADDKEKAIKAGCNDYITKPIRIKELDELLKNYFIL